MKRCGILIPNIEALRFLKRDVIYYDEITIYSDHLFYSIESLKSFSAMADKNFENQIAYYLQTMEALQKEGFVKLIDSTTFRNECDLILTPDQRLHLLENKYLVSENLKAKKYLPELLELQQTSTYSIPIELKIENLRRTAELQFKSQQLSAAYHCGIKSVIEQENSHVVIDFNFPDSIVKDRTLFTSDSNAISIVLEKIPVPSENVSLEDILQFKHQDNMLLYRDRLDRWIKGFLKEDVSIIDFKNELEYFLKEYEMHLKNSEIQYTSTSMELVLDVSASILENILKLNLGNLVRIPFKAKRAKAKYNIDKNRAPGREVAFVWEANRKFKI